MQWIGDRSEEHYKALMRTFLAVFPHTTLWQGGTLMIGSLSPLRVAPGTLEEHLRSPRVQDALSAVGLASADALRSSYTAGPDALRQFVGPGEILTDEQAPARVLRARSGAVRSNPDLSSLVGSPDESIFDRARQLRDAVTPSSWFRPGRAD